MLGIYLAEQFSFHPEVLNTILLSLFISLFYFSPKRYSYHRRWIPGVIFQLFLFLFGYQLTHYNNDQHDPLHFQEHIHSTNSIIGIVQNTPSIKNDKVKVVLKTQYIQDAAGSLKNCSGKLLVYLKVSSDTNRINNGDQLIFKGKISPVPLTKNPYAFDYREYLYFQNIHFQTYIEPTDWKVIKKSQRSFISQQILKTRAYSLNTLKKYVGSGKEAGVAIALILGNKEELSVELKEAYAESGAIHILAVSGLHVGIISGLFLFLLNCLSFKEKQWKWIKFGLIIIVIWIFAGLTGMSASVQRAALMFSALHLGLVIEREVNIYNSLAIAAFLILLWNPYTLFNIGFQFSFLAVLGIVFFSPKLLQLWVPKNWLLYQAWLLTIVGTSAQIAVFPLSIYYFHQFPTYFWLTGLFVIPFATVILYGGIMTLIFSLIAPFLADFFGSGVFHIILFQNYLISIIQALPFHILSGFWISKLEVLLYYSCILAMTIYLLSHKIRWMVSLICSLFLVSCIQFKTNYDQTHQKKIIVYANNKNSVIDFVDGKKVYTIANKKIDDTQYRYTLQNNHWALGISEVIKITEKQVVQRNLFKKENWLQFYDKKIVLVNESSAFHPKVAHPFVCDYLIVQNNPEIKIAQLFNQYKMKEIIFDGSCSYKKIRYWKESCDKLGIPYRDIQHHGACVIEL